MTNRILKGLLIYEFNMYKASYDALCMIKKNLKKCKKGSKNYLQNIDILKVLNNDAYKSETEILKLINEIKDEK